MRRLPRIRATTKPDMKTRTHQNVCQVKNATKIQTNRNLHCLGSISLWNVVFFARRKKHFRLERRNVSYPKPASRSPSSPPETWPFSPLSQRTKRIGRTDTAIPELGRRSESGPANGAKPGGSHIRQEKACSQI